MQNPHGDAMGKILVCGGEAQQFVGRSVEADANLFQCVNRGGYLPARNGAKVSLAEIAEFGSGFVGKVSAGADAENGCGEILGKHGKSLAFCMKFTVSTDTMFPAQGMSPFRTSRNWKRGDRERSQMKDFSYSPCIFEGFPVYYILHLPV